MFSNWGTLKIKRGEYRIQTPIEAKAGQRVILSGEEGAILVWEGPKHKPMFVLEENSLLAVENLQIKYDGPESEIAQYPSSARFDLLKNSKIIRGSSSNS